MLLDLLRRAVTDELALQARLGTRVGCVVSGGIDSSTVTLLASEHGPLPTLTGYYDGEKYDERRWASLVAGPDWHEILITPDDFVEHIDDCIQAIGGQLVGPGAFGQYMVARYASEHVDCVLSGEGGDELFGGYARISIVARERVPDGYENLKLPDDYPPYLEAALRYELAGLPGLLSVDAAMTAPFGLESRAPMTDIRVAAWALSQEPHDRVNKKLLRQAVRGFVPDAIVDRTDKRGFPVPFVEWANGPLRSFIRQRIGYTPDIDQPWARDWWYDLCAGVGAVAA